MKTKKIVSLLITLVMVFTMLPQFAFTVSAKSADDYVIYLDGTEITEENAGDIFRDGTASYDASTATLVLKNFATTGVTAGNQQAILETDMEGLLTIELHGNNAFAPGTNPYGILTQGSLKFTGDGNLSVSGGYVPGEVSADPDPDEASETVSIGILAEGYLTLSKDFGGCIVTAGGTASDLSAGIKARGVYIRGGTLISTGGFANNITAGIYMPGKTTDFVMEGRELIARGGDSGEFACGIFKPEPDGVFAFYAGVSVIKAGLINGSYTSENRYAFYGNPKLSEGVKIAGKVAFDSDNNESIDTTGNSNDFLFDTGVVLVPSDYQSAGDSIVNLQSNVYKVVTEAGGYAFDSTEDSINLNGNTAVSVYLGEQPGYWSTVAGLVLGKQQQSTQISNGRLICVGGEEAGMETAGIVATGNFEINDCDIIAVGGHSKVVNDGFHGWQTTVDIKVKNVNIVGVAGLSRLGDSSPKDISCGIKVNNIDATDSSILGVGGNVETDPNGDLLTNSYGLKSGTDANGESSVMGVGGIGMSSFGTESIAAKNKSTTLSVGGYAQEFSYGVYGTITSHDSGKSVALAGEAKEHSFGCANSDQTPNESSGELLVAGRTGAYRIKQWVINDPFKACPKTCMGYGYSTFAEGTPVPLPYKPLNGQVQEYKRIRVAPALCDLTIYASTWEDTDAYAPIVIEDIPRGTDLNTVLSEKEYDVDNPFEISGYVPGMCYAPKPMTEYESWKDLFGEAYYSDSEIEDSWTLYFPYAQTLNEDIDLKLTSPACGTQPITPSEGEDKVWDLEAQTNSPKAVVAKADAEYSVHYAAWLDEPFAIDQKQTPYEGVIEGEKTYNAVINVLPAIGYAFTDGTDVNLDGAEVGDFFTGYFISMIGAEVKAVHMMSDEPLYYWNGTAQVVASLKCQNCEYAVTETADTSSSVTTQPTCLTKGQTTYTAEFKNDTDFTTQTQTLDDIDATDHEYGAWKKLNDKQHQRVCGHDKSHVEKEDHTWDSGRVTRKATEKATGIKTFTCTVCNATKTETIPKLKPSEPDKFAATMGKATAKGKTDLVIGWLKVKGADGYDVFFAECNHKGKKTACKNVKNIRGNKTLTWTKSGLKRGTAYKSYVKAYVMKDGKKTYISKSPTFHAYTGGYTKRHTNAKAVKVKNVKKNKLSIKQGKTFKLKAKVIKLKKNKKLMPATHAPKLRYMTSDSKVATVTKTGKITAKGKGTCTIYVLAHNGVYKTVKVTVP